MPAPPRTCPTCDECKDEPRHHWINHTMSLTGTICKHCSAIGVSCSACDGHGKREYRHSDTAVCLVCRGAGTVEVVRMDGGGDSETDAARRRIVIRAALAQIREKVDLIDMTVPCFDE